MQSPVSEIKNNERLVETSHLDANEQNNNKVSEDTQTQQRM